MTKLSLLDAATALESICDQIDEANEADVFLQTRFEESLGNLKDSVDRRIKYFSYLDSAIDKSTEMVRTWGRRKKTLERMRAYLELQTKCVMLAEPDLPYKGELGELKLRSAGVPRMVLTGVLEQVDERFIAGDDINLLKDLEPYKKYLRAGWWLNKGALKQDLLGGEKLLHASLHTTKSVRVKI